MTPTWQSEDTPALPKLGLIGIVRAVLRGILIVLVLFLGVGLTLLFRLIEVLLFGKTRPFSGAVTVAVCRAALSIMRYTTFMGLLFPTKPWKPFDDGFGTGFASFTTSRRMTSRSNAFFSVSTSLWRLNGLTRKS